jgi:hypothetical protein
MGTRSLLHLYAVTVSLREYSHRRTTSVHGANRRLSMKMNENLSGLEMVGWLEKARKPLTEDQQWIRNRCTELIKQGNGGMTAYLIAYEENKCRIKQG